MFRSHRLPFRKGRSAGSEKIAKKTKQGRSSQGKDNLQSRMMLIGFFFLLFRREDGSVERWETVYRDGIKGAVSRNSTNFK